jgi:hypothetical protein
MPGDYRRNLATDLVIDYERDPGPVLVKLGLLPADYSPEDLAALERLQRD